MTRSEYTDLMASFADWVRKSGLLPPERFAFALEEQKRTGFRLGQILVDHGIVEETELFDAVARVSGFARLDMSTAQVDLEAARRIDPEWALEHRMMPLFVDEEGRTVNIATTDPSQSALLTDASARFGMAANPLVATESELGRLIRHAYFNEPLDRTRGGSRLTADEALPEKSMAAVTSEEVHRIQLRSFPPTTTDDRPASETTLPLRPKGLAYPTRAPPKDDVADTLPPPRATAPNIEPPAVPLGSSPTAIPPGSSPSAILPFPASAPGLTPHPGSSPSTILPFPASNPATTPHPGSSPSTILPFPASNPAMTPPGSSPSARLPFPASSPEGVSPPNSPSPPPTVSPTTTGPLGSAPSSRDLMLDALAPVAEMHQYTASAIQAIFELCVARGIITREEYLARLGTQDFPPRSS